jgi:SAM-dependent methyltransferase
LASIFDTTHLFNKYYFKRAGYLSATTAFHRLCASRTAPLGTILEIGAGPSNGTSDFLATLGSVCGVDVSDEGSRNRALSSFHLFDGKRLPFEDNSFDCCVSNWVLEHVQTPREHFREVHRVLRPGGAYFFRTMNIHHYVGAISKLTPHWFHRAVANWLRGLPQEAHDPWPTFYNCNTIGAIHRIARETGFHKVKVDVFECEPSYGKASALLFYPMFAWERAVNATDSLQRFRAQILGNLTKAP